MSVDSPRKRKPRRFQFRLRSLIALMLLASCFMWGVIQIRQAQQLEIVLAELKAAGAVIYLDYELDDDGDHRLLPSSPCPQWLRSRTSDLLFADIQRIDLSFGHNVGGLEALKACKGLKTLVWTYGEPGPVDSISQFTNLERLRIVCSGEVSAVGELQHLKQLWIWNPDVCDLDFLGGCPQLEWLECSSSELADISALGKLKSLRELQLYSRSLNSIDAVGELNQLERLDLTCPGTTDLSALARLPELNSLSIDSNGLPVDYGSIAEIPSLQSLAIVNCPPPARDEIAGLVDSGLKEIVIDDCDWAGDVAALKRFEGVPTIGVRWCELSTLDGLDAIADLSGFSIVDHNRLRNLNGLYGNTRLETLSIEGVELIDDEDMFVLNTLTALRQLRLDSLNDLTRISELQNLEDLDLSDCSSLTVLEPLESMDSLRRLSLARCRSLPGVKVLSRMKRLEYLDVSESNLTRGEIEILVDELPDTEVRAWVSERPAPR